MVTVSKLLFLLYNFNHSQVNLCLMHFFLRSIDLSHSDENVDDFFSSSNMDPALQTILSSDYPVWLTLTETQNQQKSPLTQMKQGLNLAQTLGDAAKGGFNVIYLPIDKNIWYEPTISYYVTLLHKRIIGRTVFDTKMFNGNRFDSHFYAHCTKNMSGSFSVVGVNAGDSKLDILAKLPFKSGTQYMEFILTVSVNGRVQLNGREIVEPAVLGPVPKSKLPGKATYLNMPAYSIAFWVFTEADVDECHDEESISYETDDDRLKTSSERLLQDLIVESVSRNDDKNERNAILRQTDQDVLKRDRRSIDHSPIQQELTNEIKSNGNGKGIKKSSKGFTQTTRRSKRDINSLKSLFDKFDFKKSIFDFKTPPPFKIASPFLVPPIIQDVLQNPNEAEKKIFAPLDNPHLPDRDIHLEVAVDASVNTEKFNNGPNPTANDPMVNIPQYTVNPANRLPSTALLGELTEIEMPQRNMNVEPIAKPPPKQENIQFVMKSLPPTIHVNHENMERTRSNLRKNLWPMANGQPVAKIPTFLPTMGQFQLPRIEVPQAFETRRRRRSINAETMNAAIEKRIQGLSNDDDSSADDSKVTVLAELLSMAEDIDKSERDQQSKQSSLKLGRSDFAARLRTKLEQLSGRGSEASLSLRKNDIWKKCKIIAKSVEQQCLQTEHKPMFRRSVKESISAPIKKLLAKVKESFNSQVLRHKRDIDFDDIDELNMIVKHEPNKIMPKTNAPFKLLKDSQKDITDDIEELEPSHEAKEQRLHGLFRSIGYIMNVIDTIMGRISKFLNLSETN